MEHVKVELNSGFVLYGVIEDKSDAGIWLKSNTETSFINFNTIKFIRPDPRYKECDY